MKKLVTTIIWALVGMAIGYMTGGDETYRRIITAVMMAGFPSGWRVVGKLGLIPLNMMGFCIHVLASVIAGWIALPYELIVGIIEVKKERVHNEKL